MRFLKSKNAIFNDETSKNAKKSQKIGFSLPKMEVEKMIHGFNDADKTKVEVVKKDSFAFISLTSVTVPTGTSEYDITNLAQYGITNINDWIVEGIEYAVSGGSVWSVPYQVYDDQIYPYVQKLTNYNYLVIRNYNVSSVSEEFDINITLRKKSI